MRPGPDVWQQSPIHDQDDSRPETGQPRAGAIESLNEAQKRLIGVLQGSRHGMTVRQLETRLSWSRAGVQQLLDSLLERQLVARLNTLVPSYVYRYGGVELDAE